VSVSVAWEEESVVSRQATIHRELARLHTELAEEIERTSASSEFVPEDELEQVLGSRATIRRLIKDEKLTGSLSGRRIIVRRADLGVFLEMKRARARLRPVRNAEPKNEPIARNAGMRVVGGQRAS
jgi:hypothetical protein